MAEGESRGEKLDRELEELLQELRVVLPGVEVMFAFLLAVPFTERFGALEPSQKGVYYLAFAAAALSSILLLATGAHHRIRWRKRDKERLLRTSNRLAVAGMASLAVTISSVVWVVTSVIYGNGPAMVSTGICLVVLTSIWYGIPLRRAAQDSR